MPLSRKELTNNGLICGVASAFFFSLMALFVQLAGKKVPNSEIIFVRALAGIIFFGLICGNQIRELLKVAAFPVWLRAMYGSISVYLYYSNIRTSTLATATVLTDMAPIFVLLFSIVLYRVRMSLMAACGTLLAVVGVVYLTSLSDGDINLMNPRVLSVGLLSAACGAAAYLSLAKATSRYSIYQIVWAFSVPMLFFSLSDRQEAFVLPDFYGASLLCGVIVSSFFAQLLMTLSYKYLPASIASTVGLTACIWAVGFDGIVGARTTILQCAGIFVILIGIRLSMFRFEKELTVEKKLEGSQTLQIPSGVN